MAEQLLFPTGSPDLFQLKTSILEQWQQLPLDHQATFAPVLLGQLLQSEHGPWTLAAIQTLQRKPVVPDDGPLPAHQPEAASPVWDETYFKDRLAQLEGALSIWSHRVFHEEDHLTHDEIMQSIRIVLWRRFTEKPAEWAAMPQERWMAYAKETYRWKVTGFHRDGQRKLGLVASDMECMVNDKDINDDEALSMVYTDHTQGGHFAYPREILLADLRIDLQRAWERGMQRLCASQRRDMPKLISDYLEGYTLEETCERYHWTRNRGVTLWRKLRTVFFEEVTGEKKVGYLGSHHPLTEAEKQRIRELYATGLSYKKVAALVGRSPSSVEGVCKTYPPELVAQVRRLRGEEGLSLAEIGKRIGRGKSYVGWMLSAGVMEGIDKSHDRDGQDIPPAITPREPLPETDKPL